MRRVNYPFIYGNGGFPVPLPCILVDKCIVVVFVVGVLLDNGLEQVAGNAVLAKNGVVGRQKLFSDSRSRVERQEILKHLIRLVISSLLLERHRLQMKIIDGTLACVDILPVILGLQRKRQQEQECEYYAVPDMSHAMSLG